MLQTCKCFCKVQNILLPKSCLFVSKKYYSFKSVSNFMQDIRFSLKTKPQEGNESGINRKVGRFWTASKTVLLLFGTSAFSLGFYLIVTLGSPDVDPSGRIQKDELHNKYIIIQYLIRAYRELEYYFRLVREPPIEKLLPDPLAYPYKQPKYTLVLELTDVLVHPEWNFYTGWRFKKRPLLDKFLETVHGSYEIVIYTVEHGMTVFPLLDIIDPKHIIAYKLVRDATHFTRGYYIKNLEKLNRDLSKVIYIDWNKRSAGYNIENLLKIKRWSGNEQDRSLLDLADLLKTISDNDIEDVRDVLKYYSKYEDPIKEFRDKQEKLIEELETQAAAKRQKPIKKSRWRRVFHI